MAYPSAFAAASASSWVVGDRYGVVFDGASLGGELRFFTPGEVSSIAAGTKYVSVATASGQILYFDATTDALLGTIDFPSAQLLMSADGTVTAAAGLASPLQNPPDNSVNVYSLPSATLIHAFPLGTPAPVLQISMSAKGDVISMTPSSTSGCDSEVIAVTGGTPIWCAPMPTGLLSPNGTMTVASGGAIYTNGTLTSAIPDTPVGWIDNTRLLANTYAVNVSLPGSYHYAGAYIFSSAGTNLGATPIPETLSFQVVNSDSIYSPGNNTIMSLTTGATLWASADASCTGYNPACSVDIGVGAVTGSQVIFSSGALVLVQPY
jgi:hypothetical protein